MYVLYESYTDETRNMKNLRLNTKIIGIYDNEKIAQEKLAEHIEKIQLDCEDDNTWFYKEFDKGIRKEELPKAVEIYEIFNEFIDNYEEIFYVVLEKVESDLNDNELQ